MVNIVTLDNNEHSELRVDPRFCAEYGNSVNQTLVFPNEFANLQKEYPIFFRKGQSGEFFAIVLLGLEKDENLFLSDDQWNASTVPATQKAGPFSLKSAEDAAGRPSEGFALAIDLDNPRVNGSKAADIFLPQGGHSDYLQHAEKVLHVIREGVQYSSAMFSALQSMGLIQQVDVGLRLSESEYYSIPELHSVDEQALNALHGEALDNMHKSGLLALCYFLLASRSNMSRLGDLKRSKKSSREP